MSEFINSMIPVVRTAFYTIGVTFLISVVPVLFLAVPSLSFKKNSNNNNNNNNLFSHSSGGQKSKNKVLAGLVSSKAALLCLKVAAVSLCRHMLFIWCLCVCPNFLFF